MTTTALRATIGVVGREPDERGDLTTRQCAKFRQFYEQEIRELHSNTGYGAEELGTLLPYARFSYSQRYGAIERSYLTIEPGQMATEAIAHVGVRQFEAVTLGYAVRETLATAGDQRSEGAAFGIEQRARLGRDSLTIERERQGIQAISFGESPDRASKVAHLPRIDDGNGIATGPEQLHQGFFIATSRLADNDKWTERRNIGKKGSYPFRCVREALRLTRSRADAGPGIVNRRRKADRAAASE